MVSVFGVSIIGIFLSSLFGAIWCWVFFMPMHPIRAILLIALWLTLNITANIAISRRKFHKIGRLPADNCDLVNFVAIYEKLSRSTNTFTVSWLIKKYILLNLSAAYLIIGNYQAAGNVLFRMKRFPNTRAGAAQEIYYHNNCFAYYRNTNDISSATQSMAQFEKMLHHDKLPNEQRNQNNAIYPRMQCLLRMATGDYDGCEEVFDLAYKQAEDRLSKVTAKFHLARVYMHYDRITEATEAFMYVVNHGGSSIYKKEAIGFLNELGETFSVPAEKIEAVKIFSRKEFAAMIIYLCVLFSLIVSSIVFFFPRLLREDEAHQLSQLHFYSTIEEAFTRHIGPSGTMGDILFVDEYEKGITILHWVYSQQDSSYLRVSYFMKEMREDREYYAYLVTNTPAHYRFIESFNLLIRIDADRRTQWYYTAIDRRPLYGLANDVKFHNLTINGQPVDYVIDVKSPNEDDELLLFWYISDAQVLYIPQQLTAGDVIISFD